jgi:hypothetical protein
VTLLAARIEHRRQLLEFPVLGTRRPCSSRSISTGSLISLMCMQPRHAVTGCFFTIRWRITRCASLFHTCSNGSCATLPSAGTPITQHGRTWPPIDT